jgi:hypothetical protein
MTLQEHYNAIKNGKGNKAQFLKQARQLFPQYFNQYSDFDNATNVLKSKQIINESAGGVVSKGFDIFDWKKILAEEAKAEEKKVSKEVEDANKNAFQPSDVKNVDNINFNEVLKGYYTEMKDPKNADKTGDELKDIVVKNLAKDPLHYTKDGEFGVKGLGYTTEAPGLGEPKPAKGPHKSSGYGDLDTDKKVEKVKANVQDSLGDKEAKTSMPKKVKEMSVTPQNSSGVKKMKMPGAEKKIKLQENTYDEFKEMSDRELIQWAENDGMEEMIVMDGEGGLANREELIKYLLGIEENDMYGIAGNPDEEVEYKKAQIQILDPISAQLNDLEKELISTNDPERKDEIEKKIKALEAGLQEQKLRSIIQQIIKEELKEGIHDRDILSRPSSNPDIEPFHRSSKELGIEADNYSEVILRTQYRKQIEDPTISDDELRYLLGGKGVKGFGGTPNAIEKIIKNRTK